jgi:hypothetical protein
MACKCGHEIRDHEWNFDKKPQPCNRCDCEDYDSDEDLE